MSLRRQWFSTCQASLHSHQSFFNKIHRHQSLNHTSQFNKIHGPQSCQAKSPWKHSCPFPTTLFRLCCYSCQSIALMAYQYYPPVKPTRPPTYSASQSSASLRLDSPLKLTFHRHQQFCNHPSHGNSSSQCPSPTTPDEHLSFSPASQDFHTPASTRPTTPTMEMCTRQNAAVEIPTRSTMPEKRRESLKDSVKDRIRCWTRGVKERLMRKQGIRVE